MNIARDMGLFMQMGGQTTGHINRDQLARYVTHILEEASETRDAHLAGDAVKTLDGLIDLIVVCTGAVHSMGVAPEAAWEAVHSANLRKLDGSCGERVTRPDGQIGKPVNFYGPEEDLAELCEEAGWEIG